MIWTAIFEQGGAVFTYRDKDMDLLVEWKSTLAIAIKAWLFRMNLA